MSDPQNVVNCSLIYQQHLQKLLKPYGIEIRQVEKNETIPGSFFGEREAGLLGNQLLLRLDTPVHSALHEAGHYICMDNQRRTTLDTDAAGDYDEENGVCYLQILLSDYLPDIGKERMMLDMDRWGYSFRLGSAKAWFEHDAEDARQWLITHQIIDENNQPTWQLRE
ncbi:hypothetical protein [Methylophaga pinxianii]|uniref:hypothetical protein n=1 Tax=Methylophaga pinxianii TaxID=2881052 RepID=UPI001CF3225A|nr:hypothetical protein [Methylophaga pinxianii]MCB2428351.1 hypothetical protein [Methylophaga pinxianii]UPH45288.1 hypothetical protein LGT42_012330 [Methylophaga pinxianii]